MTSKQNLVFFLGLTLIILQYYVGGQMQTLWHDMFGATAKKTPAKSVKKTSGIKIA